MVFIDVCMRVVVLWGIFTSCNILYFEFAALVLQGEAKVPRRQRTKGSDACSTQTPEEGMWTCHTSSELHNQLTQLHQYAILKFETELDSLLIGSAPVFSQPVHLLSPSSLSLSLIFFYPVRVRLMAAVGMTMMAAVGMTKMSMRDG